MLLFSSSVIQFPPVLLIGVLKLIFFRPGTKFLRAVIFVWLPQIGVRRSVYLNRAARHRPMPNTKNYPPIILPTACAAVPCRAAFFDKPRHMPPNNPERRAFRASRWHIFYRL